MAHAAPQFICACHNAFWLHAQQIMFDVWQSC